MTGAFSRNVGKLFSKLKLVTDNLLFIYAEANWEATESKLHHPDIYQPKAAVVTETKVTKYNTSEQKDNYLEIAFTDLVAIRGLMATIYLCLCPLLSYENSY